MKMFDKAPRLQVAEQLKAWDIQTQTADGWKMARPEGLWGLRSRLRLAWGVFTGKYDALKWHRQ